MRSHIYTPNKGSSLDIQKSLSNSPLFKKFFSTTPYGEYHWINTNGKTDNFTGANTQLQIRLDGNDIPHEWSKPIDPIDNISYWHDIQYRDIEDLDIPDNEKLNKKHIADNIMIQKLKSLSNLTFKQKVKSFIVQKILQAKVKFGGSLVDELHREYRKNKYFLKVKVFSKDDIWTADLIEMPNDKGYKYGLTVMDLYTKYAWVKPLKNKTGEHVFNAFKEIIKESNRKPNKLFVDNGKEFYNKHFYSMFHYDKNKVAQKDDQGNYINKIYSVFNDQKSAPIERLNRTLKSKLFKKFTEQKNQKWLHILDDVVNVYNNKIHSSIGISPKEASENSDKIKQIITDNNYYNETNLKQQKPKYKIGDRVRIYKWKNKFEKGYIGYWTNEVFKINKIKKTNPITYELVALDGEEIIGSFYQNELQKTDF